MIEKLESRRFLAGTAELVIGVLTVRGTVAADVVGFEAAPQAVIVHLNRNQLYSIQRL